MTERGRKSSKLLKRYGEPVQLSVFEAIINDAQFAAMRSEVARILGRDADQLRYYDICQTCDHGILTFGQARTTVLPGIYIA